MAAIFGILVPLILSFRKDKSLWWPNSMSLANANELGTSMAGPIFFLQECVIDWLWTVSAELNGTINRTSLRRDNTTTRKWRDTYPFSSKAKRLIVLDKGGLSAQSRWFAGYYSRSRICHSRLKAPMIMAMLKGYQVSLSFGHCLGGATFLPSKHSTWGRTLHKATSWKRAKSTENTRQWWRHTRGRI